MISYTKNKYYIQFLRVFQFLVKANERKGEKERKEKRRWDHKQERNGFHSYFPLKGGTKLTSN